MNKVYDFLKEAGTFYYATIEDNKPIMRPFGFLMEFEDKLYIGMGTYKNCYKQTIADPNISICACKPNRQWIRISAKAVPDTRPEAIAHVFEVAPSMKNLYSEKTGHEIGIFYLENAEAEIVVGQNKEIVKF